MTRKNSKQREMLLTELRSRHDHPIAEDIYVALKKKLPDISLGTVYRNLSVFTESGDISRLEVNGPDRYDGNPAAHYHFACNECGRVLDVNLPYCEELDRSVENATGAFVERNNIIFYGTCGDCLKKKKN